MRRDTLQYIYFQSVFIMLLKTYKTSTLFKYTTTCIQYYYNSVCILNPDNHVLCVTCKQDT